MLRAARSAIHASPAVGSVEVLGAAWPFARVRGDLARVRPDRDGPVLQRLLLRHGVLVFPEQVLTPAQELAAYRAFGLHEEGSDFTFGFEHWGLRPAVIPGFPAVQIQGRCHLEDHFGFSGTLNMSTVSGYKSEGFHSDGLHDTQDPLPGLTQIYCHTPTTKGGETRFACSRRMLQDRSDQAFLRKLQVHYLSVESQAVRGLPVMTRGVVCSRREKDLELGVDPDDPRHADGGVVHPLVQAHPVSGEEAVRVSCGNLGYIEASASMRLSRAESYQLLDDLVGAECDAAYVHQWSAGDFVIWDNRLCLHCGPDEDAMDGDRLMHRIRMNAPTLNSGARDIEERTN